MTAISIVSYVRPTDGREPNFDVEYYFKTHMPLVEKALGPYGLIEWEASQEAETSPFYYVCILHFKSVEGLRKAAAKIAPEVFDDVKNFTDMDIMTSSGSQSGHWKK